MNRLDATRRPERFELEAAARRHRTAAWVAAFEVAAHWISAHSATAKTPRTAAASLHVLPHRAAH